MNNLEKLRSLAKSAQKGPYSYELGPKGEPVLVVEGRRLHTPELHPGTVRFLAALDPRTVIDLIDQIVILQQGNNSMHDWVESLYCQACDPSTSGDHFCANCGYGKGSDLSPDDLED